MSWQGNKDYFMSRNRFPSPVPLVYQGYLCVCNVKISKGERRRQSRSLAATYILFQIIIIDISSIQYLKDHNDRLLTRQQLIIAGTGNPKQQSYKILSQRLHSHKLNPTQFHSFHSHVTLNSPPNVPFLSFKVKCFTCP